MLTNSVQQFVQECASLDSNAIYDKFEDMSDELREEVFAAAETLGVVLQDECEPTRASLYTLGKHCNVQSLIDY